MDGIAKNIEHIKEELAGWKSGMAAPLREYHDADGVPESLHKLLNLVTESVRLLPYTLAHALIVGVIADGALHIWLWLR